MTSYTAPKEGATFGDRFRSALIALFVVSKFGRSIRSFKDSPVTARFAEFAVTFATAALSTVIYAFACGSWWIAAGLVGMIFVHEMGHVLAIRLEGLETRAPVFIPLLGAFVTVPELKGGAQEAASRTEGRWSAPSGSWRCSCLRSQPRVPCRPIC